MYKNRLFIGLYCCPKAITHQRATFVQLLFMVSVYSRVKCTMSDEEKKKKTLTFLPNPEHTVDKAVSDYVILAAHCRKLELFEK